MNDRIGELNKKWTDREALALELALKKMKADGLMDENLNPLPNDIFDIQTINKIFERQLENFRLVVHNKKEPMDIRHSTSLALDAIERNFYQW